MIHLQPPPPPPPPRARGKEREEQGRRTGQMLIDINRLIEHPDHEEGRPGHINSQPKKKKKRHHTPDHIGLFAFDARMKSRQRQTPPGVAAIHTKKHHRRCCCCARVGWLKDDCHTPTTTPPPPLSASLPLTLNITDIADHRHRLNINAFIAAGEPATTGWRWRQHYCWRWLPRDGVYRPRSSSRRKPAGPRGECW